MKDSEMPPSGWGFPSRRKAGVGRTTVYALMKAGDLRAVKIGRRTIILYADLQRFADSLPSAQSR